MKDILIGNSFPLPLINRTVEITVLDLERFKDEIVDSCIHSYWGHQNTISVAEKILGVSLKSDEFRKAIELSENDLPLFNNIEFTTCYVLSPNYNEGFRPAIGVEVEAENILSWKLLKLKWK